jgi:2-(1,2-epoxy-1,2-dihydrophenyl)acetyl-CoA isomerase
VLPELAEDAEVGSVILTGAGRGFCSGGDVQGQAQRASEVAAAGGSSTVDLEARIEDLRRRQNGVSLALHRFPKVTIAAIRGAAAGAGMSIALSCDLRIASESAFITSAFPKVGFSGDFGGSWFLTQLIGAAKAREFYLTSDRVNAETAERLGIFNRVVPDDELSDAAMNWAKSFASGPRVAYRYIKENINRALVADLATCLDAEAVAMTRTGLTEDHREASRAFVEKRPPSFRGR